MYVFQLFFLQEHQSFDLKTPSKSCHFTTPLIFPTFSPNHHQSMPRKSIEILPIVPASGQTSLKDHLMRDAAG
jgi:hypothetical protein